jgi:hypothetical protein
MMTLVFLVMFGPKKGSIVAYSSAWDFSFTQHSQLLSHTPHNTGAGWGLSPLHGLGHRYLQTSVTSRFTSYVLFSFWIFFFFYGETLLLVVLNYSTPVDTISSSSFFVIKQHVVFFLTTSSSQLMSHINFYIYFLTSCSFMYLINLNFAYNYNYFKLSSVTSSLVGVAALVSVLLTCI